MRLPRLPKLHRYDGYSLLVGGPVPPQAAAITLGRVIVVRRSCANDQDLLAHELVHVRQFDELGWARFVWRYVGTYLRLRFSGHGHMAAYRRIPLEVEASWLSRLHDRAELEPASCELAEPVAAARVPGRLPLEVVADRAEAVIADARQRPGWPSAHRRRTEATSPA